MYKYFTLLVLGISLQLTFGNIEEDLQNLNIAGIGELPSNITSKIPSEADVEKAFAEKCKKQGGQEAYDKAKVAKQEAVECIKGLVDFDTLQMEMEEAKPTGDLDSVFKKYCKRSPQFKACISNFTTAFEPCLEKNEKDSVKTVLNVTEQLAEFICFKEGDRIALFVAEGGPECLNSSKDGIRGCLETVYKQNFPNPDEVTMNDLPLLLFKAEQCEEFYKLQTCIVKELEKCQGPTPANIVDALFNFVKKVTPCSSFKFKEETVNKASRSDSSTIHSFFGSIFSLLTSFCLLRLIDNH